MKKKFSKLSKVIIMVIVMVSIIIVFLYTKKADAPVVNNTGRVTQNINILGNKDDLVGFSIAPGTKVAGVISYRGEVKNAYFFEGNILINILDLNKNVLKASNASAKGEWMTTGPVNFEGNIDFTGLPKGPAYFEIQNDDPSGGEGGPAKKILIPIIIE
jgi:hypothetical protein